MFLFSNTSLLIPLSHSFKYFAYILKNSSWMCANLSRQRNMDYPRRQPSLAEVLMTMKRGSTISSTPSPKKFERRSHKCDRSIYRYSEMEWTLATRLILRGIEPAMLLILFKILFEINLIQTNYLVLTHVPDQIICVHHTSDSYVLVLRPNINTFYLPIILLS